MKTRLFSAALAALLGTSVVAEDRVGNFGAQQSDALPFSIEFREISSPPGTPPRLHSFRKAGLASGHWLMMGGRGATENSPPEVVDKSGLHGFAPSQAPEPDRNNFPRPTFNTWIWVYHPVTGATASFDVTQLSQPLRAALTTTSQQSWYDRETGELWIIGGYGWTVDGSDMKTFDTLIRVNAEKLATAVLNSAPASEVEPLFEMLTDEKLAVTGGELVMVDDVLYIVFGQLFDGQYFAFGDDDPQPFKQIYTEEIRVVELVPGRFEILNISALAKDNPAEYHRRDLNVKMTRDPATGATLVGAYGGVFKSGGPGGFENPITMNPANGTITVHTDGVQIFNGYATAVVSVWAEQAKVMSQVFFGGIGKGVYHTHDQDFGFDDDGMPFGSDVSVLAHSASDGWKEYVLPEPVPGNKLLAANGAFFINPDVRTANQVADEEILLLDALPSGKATLVGWIYGGILADMPQPPKGPPQNEPGKEPVVPTKAANNLFEVWVTPGAGAAIPVLP